MDLKLLSTHDVRLNIELNSQFAVLHSTQIFVIRGRETDNDLWALHMYRLNQGRLEKIKTVKYLCKHYATLRDILGLSVEGEELLAGSCEVCQDIKLVNIYTGKTTVAYENSKYELWRMCEGEAGRLWVSTWKSKVIELDCTKKTFTETGNMFTIAEKAYFMCFLPPPHRALVLSFNTEVVAVSCETGEELWRVKEVDGKLLNPWSITFSPYDQALLVADPYNSRVLVLNPSDGSHLQTLTYPQLGPIFNLHWRNNTLTVLSQEGDVKLAFLGMNFSGNRFVQTVTH